MRVDIVDIRGGETGPLQRRFHSAEPAVAIFGRRRDMVGVARHPVPLDLGIDGRTSGSGMLELLQYNNARAFAHHKPVTPLVPRA